MATGDFAAQTPADRGARHKAVCTEDVRAEVLGKVMNFEEGHLCRHADEAHGAAINLTNFWKVYCGLQDLCRADFNQEGAIPTLTN